MPTPKSTEVREPEKDNGNLNSGIVSNQSTASQTLNIASNDMSTDQNSRVNISPPDPFDFRKPESWTTWVTRFVRYMSVANLNSRSSKEKVDLLCYTMGAEAEDILARISTDENKDDYDSVKKLFDAYFAPKKNVVFERCKFNTRVQQQGESVDEYITALYSLAKKCDYSTLKAELIRDRIVIGIADKKVSQRLQLARPLRLLGKRKFKAEKQKSYIQTKEKQQPSTKSAEKAGSLARKLEIKTNNRHQIGRRTAEGRKTTETTVVRDVDFKST